MEMKHEKEIRELDKNWLEVFPEAIKLVKKQQRELTKLMYSYNKDIDSLNIQLAMFEKYSVKYLKKKLKIFKVKNKIKRIRDRYFYNKRMLSRVIDEKMKLKGITDADIDLAKQHPIEDMYEFQYAGVNRMKTKCPFHEENTPSLVLFQDQNTYHCFGCGVGGDSIDFYMRLNDCDFITTVKKLR